MKDQAFSLMYRYRPPINNNKYQKILIFKRVIFRR